jgi:hypothetical protein
MQRPEPDDFERALRRFDRGTLAVYIRWCWFRDLRDPADEMKLVGGMRGLLRLEAAGDALDRATHAWKEASRRGDPDGMRDADVAIERANRDWARALKEAYPRVYEDAP